MAKRKPKDNLPVVAAEVLRTLLTTDRLAVCLKPHRGVDPSVAIGVIPHIAGGQALVITLGIDLEAWAVAERAAEALSEGA